MKTPKQILPLIEDGIVDEVISQLMSGKEASVYVVRCGEHIRCAKVYKDVQHRSFKQAVKYQEGRKVRNSRRGRAMEKGSKFGRKEQENVWQNAEVDALFTLSRVGVKVPQPHGCYDGVLIMDLVTDNDGDVAPRLNDVSLTAEQAIEDHATMVHYIRLMLCAGIVHGDLSEFNVLVDSYGPVVIDLPQAVNAAANNNAQEMFLRDVRNMRLYYGQYAPEILDTRFGEEMWALYQAGELTAETVLYGNLVDDHAAADVDSVLDEIKAAFEQMQENQERIKAAQAPDEE
ncbi:PA4780 family RIO1-like protein kinase [Pseudoalteromonas neustonica]|uniref:PA4780 family RIO1-like protein kinase n=1 Tax=Pseudoalteromonas neustonica TaxID=1840331 RepID=UPI0007DAF813|nr:PA4780 family RIO1-like protein kinase [Pseudoalteromonas neustonica]